MTHHPTLKPQPNSVLLFTPPPYKCLPSPSALTVELTEVFQLLGAVKVLSSLLTASSPFFPFLSFTNFPGFSPHSSSPPCTLVLTSSPHSFIPISFSCNLDLPCIFIPHSEANQHCSCSHHKAISSLIH